MKDTPPINPRAVNRSHLEELFVGGHSIMAISETLNVQIATIRRHLGEMGLLQRYKHGPRDPNDTQKPILFAAANELPTTFIDRDPCGFCGVRGDIWCKHKRVQESEYKARTQYSVENSSILLGDQESAGA